MGKFKLPGFHAEGSLVKSNYHQKVGIRQIYNDTKITPQVKQEFACLGAAATAIGGAALENPFALVPGLSCISANDCFELAFRERIHFPSGSFTL